MACHDGAKHARQELRPHRCGRQRSPADSRGHRPEWQPRRAAGEAIHDAEDAVGRARPAGHVLQPDDHAVRASGQRQRPRVLHARGSGGDGESGRRPRRRRRPEPRHARRRRARLQRLLVGSRHESHDAAHVAGGRSSRRPRAGVDRGGAQARGRRGASGRRSAAPARADAAPTPGSIAARSSAASRAACPAR